MNTIAGYVVIEDRHMRVGYCKSNGKLFTDWEEAADDATRRRTETTDYWVVAVHFGGGA